MEGSQAIIMAYIRSGKSLEFKNEVMCCRGGTTPPAWGWKLVAQQFLLVAEWKPVVAWS